MSKTTTPVLRRLLDRLTRKRNAEPRRVSTSPFQAIAIYRGVNACPMAKRFSEHRFLVREAPALPLLECTMPQTCECRYLRFKDRRAGERRLNDFAAATGRHVKSERRVLRGRRKTD